MTAERRSGGRGRRRRNRRKRFLRGVLEFFLIAGSFALLTAFAINSIKAWEREKWEQTTAISEADGWSGGVDDEAWETEQGTQDETPVVKDAFAGTDIALGEGGVLTRPMKRTKEEALARLRELEYRYPKMEDVLARESDYPEEMLEALANNPEMLDFVLNYKSNKRSNNETAELTKEEKAQKRPLFLQWDERWGYASYGDGSCVGLAGCGPTCLSMVLYYKTGDAERTPDVLADYAMRNGYYVSGTGTAWAFMEEGAKDYGLRVRTLSKSETAFKAALDKGRLIICAMGPGDFTAAGHFIVIYGYDEEGFHINDPNSRARSAKRWGYDEIAGQIKAIWSYS